MRTRLGIALVFAIGACGKGQEPHVDPALACHGAAESSVIVMAKEARERPARDGGAQDLEAMAPRMRDMMRTRCLDDKWPRASVQCFTKAQNLDQVRNCRGALSADQQVSLQKDELALMAPAIEPPPPVSPSAGSAAVPGSDPLLPELDKATQELLDAKTDDERIAAQIKINELKAKRFESGDYHKTLMAEVEKRLASVERKIDEMTKQISSATDATEREWAKDKLRVHREERELLKQRLADAKADKAAQAERIAEKQKLLEYVDAKIEETTATIAKASTAAERERAKAQLAEYETQRAAVKEFIELLRSGLVP